MVYTVKTDKYEVNLGVASELLFKQRSASYKVPDTMFSTYEY